MSNAKAIEALKEALRCLPGVGPKNAQRMAFHLLERDREGAQSIADALQNALHNIGHCERCNTFSEQTLCDICSSVKRDKALLCIVETPADLEAIEQVGAYSGLYFVLMGVLSPLDGVGPETLALDKLHSVLQREPISEIIIATNLTVEGETTADYLFASLQQYEVTTSRLARGVPVGGELEYMDQGTVAQAFRDRKVI
ncbi:MAG: recombination mediator RecR [Arenicella sp.]